MFEAPCPKLAPEQECGGFGDKWIDNFHGRKPNRVENCGTGGSQQRNKWFIVIEISGFHSSTTWVLNWYRPCTVELSRYFWLYRRGVSL
jgi:hypothetical protein